MKSKIASGNPPLWFSSSSSTCSPLTPLWRKSAFFHVECNLEQKKIKKIYREPEIYQQSKSSQSVANSVAER